jgi:hypothetical protein
MTEKTYLYVLPLDGRVTFGIDLAHGGSAQEQKNKRSEKREKTEGQAAMAARQWTRRGDEKQKKLPRR